MSLLQAFENGSFLHADCAAHKLNLAVINAAYSETEVEPALTLARGIVRHFKHSDLANEKLRACQTDEGLNVLCLIQVNDICELCTVENGYMHNP